MNKMHLDKFLFFVILLLTVFAVVLQLYTTKSTEKLKQQEIAKTEHYASKIASFIDKRTNNNLALTLSSNTQLRESLNQSLQAFLTKEYRYIFVLDRDKKGNYHFLLDGSQEDPEAYHSPFFPKNELFNEVYLSQKMQMIEQSDEVEGIWVSLIYPIVKEGETQALLVLDLSKSYGEYLNDFNSPLIQILSMMQLFLVISMVVLFYILYRYNKVRTMLLFDALTQTYTKLYLKDFFNTHKLEMYNMMLIDMDNFTKINSEYGYKQGDKIIQQFTTVMKNTLPSVAKIIRTAGTEFLVIVPKKNIRFEPLVRNLFESLSDRKYILKDKVLHQTVSMSAIVTSSKETSIYDIQRLLDVKLLALKSRGKNRFDILSPKNLETFRYAQMEEIKEALAQNRLLCLYQPIIEIKSQKIIKYEALVRLIDKEDKTKLISPIHFLSTIQGTSQYIKMSKLVFQNVFEALKNYPTIEISVNLDLDDLYNEDMMKLIKEHLEQHQHLANRVTFEILETNQIDDYQKVDTIFKELKSFGSKIAIDDFGSGYANYVYLLKLDIDILKLDGSIIKELLTHPKRTKIMLASLNALAQSYRYELVAEFVSNKRLYEHISSLEIRYAQGYYLGKPEALSFYMPK